MFIFLGKDKKYVSTFIDSFYGIEGILLKPDLVVLYAKGEHFFPLFLFYVAPYANCRIATLFLVVKTQMWLTLHIAATFCVKGSKCAFIYHFR